MRKIMLGLICLVASLVANARERDCFDKGWLFTLGDNVNMSSVGYDDHTWRTLNLPHDWSIEGDFYAGAPSGAGGGALPGGIGWYRKHFTVNPKDKTSRYFIDFDGVYMNSTVYLNGHKLGTRPYGFISFRYELTPYLKPNGDNVIAVKVDNSQQPNCRWYSGSGIYRHVWIIKTNPVHIAHWGTQVVSTVDLDKGTGTIDVAVTMANASGKLQHVKLRTTVLDTYGHAVATKTTASQLDDSATVSQKLSVAHPKLWQLDNTCMYKVKAEVLSGSRVLDDYTTDTGFRSFHFDAATGFSLNGKPTKINGVCLHHDLGCLGAAINEDALWRQLRMMKDMGANAIRCSHNPPAPELLNICDTMGLLVMDEAFDVWHKQKTRYDYALNFDEWYERDLTDMLLRDRNHPSIFLWSIGNEVLEQWTHQADSTLTLEQANTILNLPRDASMLAKDGVISFNQQLTTRLADIVKRLDRSRLITAGCNEPSPNNHLFRSGSIDVIGFNYHNPWVKDVPKNFPGKPFLMTETVSALATRGYYKMPSDSIFVGPREWWIPYTDPSFSCSSYDNMHVGWGNTHEETLDMVKHTPHCAGQFIWTGWDYIGEPTPFTFPARSSYFGIVDLAGFPKDVYYLYQSEWTDRPVLHLFPHWSWIEGQTVDMWCYYNKADEVELFINGRSQGIRKKQNDHEYHVMWRVTFEPGEVKAVARRNGSVVSEQVIKTAGVPTQIRLVPDKTQINADGSSLAFVTVEVTDDNGNVCPWADNDIQFSVTGGAQIAGVDNGSQSSMESFKANHRKAFNGKCIVMIQSANIPGDVTMTAKSVGLKNAETTIHQK